MARNLREVAPRVWMPAIPLRAPIDVRWRCDHRWTPTDPMIEWGCLNCGVRRDGVPKNGYDWPYRLWRKLSRRGSASQ